ncbi:hypothetical protein R1sor_026325 [Riccia sorocarpa]|uniref:DUF7869 domain-containing protein n=1 Tax=Riccia sorocarpa TaxID=122646 RepID=A0ABD3GCT4_9MARC
MKTFFQQTAEPLPHKESKNENTDGIFYRLPKAYSRDDVYQEISHKMEAVDMTPISSAAFDSIWRKDFPNFNIHNSSAFAKCQECLKFITMLQRERISAPRAKLELDREKHLKHQMSGRTVYYSHRELSTSSPSLYLSFIHDAMDLAKTIIPRLCDKVKTLMGSVLPLPLKVIGILNLIGILNHGHEPGVVAHVTVGGLWPSDPNFTITSIAKQLRDYESYHTALDVDAFFSKVNAAQGGKDIESLPHFLAEVYHAQSSKAYPRVIQEVADYKQHVKDYVIKIQGQSSPVAFRFYMRDNILVYQVQETYGGKWVPQYGRTFWKRCELELRRISKCCFLLAKIPSQRKLYVHMQKRVRYWDTSGLTTLSVRIACGLVRPQEQYVKIREMRITTKFPYSGGDRNMHRAKHRLQIDIVNVFKEMLLGKLILLIVDPIGSWQTLVSMLGSRELRLTK